MRYLPLLAVTSIAALAAAGAMPSGVFPNVGQGRRQHHA